MIDVKRQRSQIYCEHMIFGFDYGGICGTERVYGG